MRKLLPAAAGVALLCSSCLPVPFDLALSQGAALASKMTRDNPYLLTFGQGMDPSEHGSAFYPQVLAAGPDYAAGFVVSMRDLDVQVEAVRQSSAGMYYSYSGRSFTIANPDPHAPPYLAWPVQGGSSYLLGMTFDALDPFNANGYARFWGDTTTNMLNVLNGAAMTMHDLVSTDPGIFNLAVAGASVNAGVGSDTIRWLGEIWPGGGAWLELSYSISAGGLGTAVEPRGLSWYPLPFLPATLARCTYFYDDNLAADPARSPNRSFASWWDSSSGSWVSYAWWGSAGFPPTGSQQLPIDHRLDALLSTGQLLSTEDGTARLYDRDGNLLATFTLGNLLYVGEIYVGGVPRCYFSQCLIYDHTQHFNVYWIPTDRLATLAD